jgi:transcriptional regulator with XRE-family HTH domain
MEVTTGHQLRVERVAANLSVNAVCAAMKTSRTTLWAIERAAIVRPHHVKAYRDALARLSQRAA